MLAYPISRLVEAAQPSQCSRCSEPIDQGDLVQWDPHDLSTLCLRCRDLPPEPEERC